MNRTLHSALAIAVTVAAGVLPSAWAGLSSSGSDAISTSFSEDALPDGVKVPAGHRVALQTVGVGQIRLRVP